MATRRLKPEDWAPHPQTRIQIRAAPTSREHEHGPLLAQKKSPRPSPINYPPGESPPIPKGRESLDTDAPSAPEVVDFAAPSTWPRRGVPPHIVFQQQQQPWATKRVASPSSISQYSSRQSEMSFGILDYYTRDPSPPLTPKLPLISQAAPKIGTPVIDPAMQKFDFGLPFKSRPRSEAFERKQATESATRTSDADAGAQHPGSDSPSPTPPLPPPETDKPEPATRTAKPIYSLFPKNTTPPSRPSLTLHNRQDTTSTPEATTLSDIFHQQPNPSYRPRKESLTSSLRSRKDSFTSYRTNAQRIPLRVFSASSTSGFNSGSSVYTTPRTSNALPPITANASSRGHRMSSSSATNTTPPPSAPGSQQSQTQSRWSEDTITSPTLAAFYGQNSIRRASFGSLLRGVGEEERQSGQYPACFFEDDDDEGVPLRRKLNWGLQGRGKGRSVSGEWEDERRGRGGGWRRVLLCGCGG